MAYVLTVPAGTVAADRTGFPVRVDLSHMPAGWWSEVVTHGSGAIRVRSAGVDVPRDVVVADTGTSTGLLFFKADLSAAVDNEFTVDVVAGATEPSVTNATGRNAVWSMMDFFIAFAGGVVDRSGKATSIQTTGTPTYSSDGAEFTGAQWFRVQGMSKRSIWTMGARVVGRSAVVTSRTFLSYTESGSNAAGDREIGYHRSGNIWASYNDSNLQLQSGSTRTLNVPGTFVLAHSNGVSRTNYVNGVLDATASGAATRPGGASTSMVVIGNGMNTTSDGPFYGAIDFAWLRGGLLTAAEVAEQYESWESPATFYSVTTGDATGAFAAATPAPVSALTGAVLVQGEFSALTPAPTSALVGGEPAGVIGGQFGATTPAPTSALEGFVNFTPFEPPVLDTGLTFELSNTVTYPPTPADPSTVAIGRTAVSVPE